MGTLTVGRVRSVLPQDSIRLCLRVSRNFGLILALVAAGRCDSKPSPPTERDGGITTPRRGGIAPGISFFSDAGVPARFPVFDPPVTAWAEGNPAVAASTGPVQHSPDDAFLPGGR